MSSKLFEFENLYLALAISFDNQYLSYVDPENKQLALFFYGQIDVSNEHLSYEEMLQKAFIFMDTIFTLPSILFSEAYKLRLLKQISDKKGNLLLCLEFFPEMDIEDAISIQLKSGSSNNLSFFDLKEAEEWEPKERYTEKFMKLLHV